jgi:MoxR-like ATPase
MENVTQTDTRLRQLTEESSRFHSINLEVGKVIVGQHDTITFILIAMLCNGHILLEGVPGVAKTTMIKAITRSMGFDFGRIQFTPDLLPADLIGTLVYNPETRNFQTRKGPIFTNLLLADEINRAPAKVQAALLEGMQERQVTIGSTSYPLEHPFLVFATQNPIEQEGTYKLPEAQIDRFMFKLLVTYPDRQQEKELLLRTLEIERIQQVLNAADFFSAQKLVAETIYVDEKIIDYIVSIVFATRDPIKSGISEIAPYILYGVSPRATIALNAACRAHAFLKKRSFVIPDDVKAVALPILRHRLVLTYEAEAHGKSADNIINAILNTLPSP